MPVEHDKNKADAGTGPGSTIDGVVVSGTPSTGQVITATGSSAANWQMPSGGGGADFTGSGSPEGVQTAVVGKTYKDTTNGSTYIKASGSGNTGWAAADVLPGIFSGMSNLPPGMLYDPTGHDLFILSGGAGSGVVISDAAAQASGATTNGLYYRSGGSDGNQNVFIALGSTDQFEWAWNADGTTTFPAFKLFDHAGNPNTHVTAANVGDLCVDTSTPALYQAGATGTSSWVKVGSFPTYTGSGNPEAAQTGSVGQTYQDTTNGGLYYKYKGSATNTGWVSMGANLPGSRTGLSGVPTGIFTDSGQPNPWLVVNVETPNGHFGITDSAASAPSGTSNGLYYFAGAADGAQEVDIFLGPADQYAWLFTANGVTALPGSQLQGYPGTLTMGGAHNSDRSVAVSGVQTTSATPAPLQSVNGDAFSFAMPNFNVTGLVTGEVVARRTDTAGTDSAWTFRGVIRGTGAVATPAYSWVGGSAPTFTLVAQDAGASTWTGAVSISGKNIVVTVTGQAAKTISWACNLTITDAQ